MRPILFLQQGKSFEIPDLKFLKQNLAVAQKIHSLDNTFCSVPNLHSKGSAILSSMHAEHPSQARVNKPMYAYNETRLRVTVEIFPLFESFSVITPILQLATLYLDSFCGDCLERSDCTYVQSDLSRQSPLFYHFYNRNIIQCHLMISSLLID